MHQAVRAQTAGNLELAESIYRALLAEKVKVAAPYSNLGMICAQTGRNATARKLFKTALALDPGFADARMHLASLHELEGEPEQAIDCYQNLLSRDPGLVRARYLLANQLKARGKLDEAVEHYLRIMQQQPDYTQAHFTYSGVHKYKESNDPHIATMLGLLQSGSLDADGRIHLNFALAKAYEDLEDYPEAFRYLETGNDLRYRKFNYLIDGDKALNENIIETFTAESLAGLGIAGQQSDRPIFIVGMPRSGTTLVEKILASHSDVQAGGELENFYALGVSEFLRRSGNFQFRPLDSYAREIFESTGRAYLEQTDRLAGQAGRLTDKLPMNFQMIGLIRLVLPNARIIHCVRDARDTCLSIYKQNFTTDNYRFAYNLRTVGQFHNLYRKLMKHWHQVMPGAIYDIEYESLTHDPEQEIRKLLSACGLEWQDACLDFHQSEGTVTTASFYQVRQPMYTSSVQLWQRYGENLQPLLDALDDSASQNGTRE